MYNLLIPIPFFNFEGVVNFSPALCKKQPGESILKTVRKTDFFKHVFFLFEKKKIRSVHACVRGSRTSFRSKIEQSLDCKINVANADI